VVKSGIIHRIFRIGKVFLITLGSIAAIMIILAFTSAPFWIRYNLGTAKSAITGVPDYIVVLGGGGIPSESGLMRTYYGAKAAKQFPKAIIIVALPGDIEDSLSSVNQMKQELIVRGVAPERIMLEDSGMNTRAEALFVKEIIENNSLHTLHDPRSLSLVSYSTSFVSPPSSHISLLTPHLSPLTSHLLLITSPSHLYRSVLTFQKVGFKRVDGVPAFERDLESGLYFSAKKLASGLLES